LHVRLIGVAIERGLAAVRRGVRQVGNRDVGTAGRVPYEPVSRKIVSIIDDVVSLGNRQLVRKRHKYGTAVRLLPILDPVTKMISSLYRLRACS